MHILKQLAVIAVLGAIGAGGYWGWATYSADATATGPAQNTRPARVTTVEVAPAVLQPLSRTSEAVGSTRAIRSVNLTPISTGLVRQLGFSDGDIVNAGDSLVCLDNEIEHADVLEAEANLEDATNNLRRAESLRRANAAAQATVENLTTQLAVAEAQLERAQRHLSDRTVRAPFDGVVGFTDVAIGDRVEEGDVIAILKDMSAIQVEFALPETVYGQVAEGSLITAYGAAFGTRTFEGRIDSLDNIIDSTSRTFRARATLDNGDNAIPAGMFMHVTVPLQTVTALMVPEAAIIVEGSETHLFTVDMSGETPTAQRRDVIIGQRIPGFVQILDGLEAGEQVIVMGHQRLRPGAALSVRDHRPVPAS